MFSRSVMRRPSTSTPFPYTTLFRSVRGLRQRAKAAVRDRPVRAAAVPQRDRVVALAPHDQRDRKSTRLNSSHANNSYAVFCLKKERQRKRNALGQELCRPDRAGAIV